MYKLQYMNVVREVATEIEKDNLIADGYVLIEDVGDEISQDEQSDDNIEESSEDNTDETDNKAGKKSGKAKK
ncbi:hypothetical protein [Peptoanaerobacter stomatis]|uniref:hypothetical protein n=1 Tax=Peptoanaerobacter stomatis TaxID=796937 RepID=UPI003F9EBA9C